MLTPTGNLQSWINNANNQLTRGCDIYIQFFETYNGEAYYRGTIHQDYLESFNISESLSIVGSETPITNITFKVFKDESGLIDEFLTDCKIIRIFYGYKHLNSYVEKGVYEISKVSIPNNGLFNTVEAKTLGYKALEQNWEYGGLSDSDKFAWQTYIENEIKKFDNNNYFQFNWVGFTNLSTMHFFPQFGSSGISKTIISILTSLAQINRCYLRIKGFIDANNHYGLKIEYISNSSYDFEDGDGYIVEYDNQFKKPEYIVSSEYDYDGISVIEQVVAYKSTDVGFVVGEIVLNSVKSNGTFNDVVYEYLPLNSNGSLTTIEVYDEHDVEVQGYSRDITKLCENKICFSTSPQLPSNYTVKLFYPCILDKWTLEYGQSGTKTIQIDNPFVSNGCNTRYNLQSYYDDTHLYANNVVDMFNQYKNSKEMEFDVRFDPRLEIGDVIITFVNEHQAILNVVESYTMNFNGSFKGKIQTTIVDSNSHYRYKVIFLDANNQVYKKETVWSGDTATPPTNPPVKPILNNACIESYEFDEWTPSISTPITQDTTFTPQYITHWREYEKVSDISGETSSFYGQIVYFTYTTGTRPQCVPHICDFTSLIENISTSIGGNLGARQQTTSTPTYINADNDNKLWQHNYIKFEKTNNMWRICLPVFQESIEPRYFCYKGTLNKTYGLLTLSEISSGGYTILERNSLQDLINLFESNTLGTQFTISTQQGHTTNCHLYKYN